MSKNREKKISKKFFFLGGPRGQKNRIFKKFSKSADFLYAGVFRHEESIARIAEA
jgi:hypothetical protein